MIYSAIPSWYGYRYQGQLAIYYAIRSIEEILEKINESDDERKESILKQKLEKYAIEIEHMEDFAIRYCEDDANLKYISFHQVKASDSERKIGKDAIYGVIENMIEADRNGLTKDTIGYIHVSDKSYDLADYDFKKIYDEQRDKQLKELQKIISIQNDWEDLFKCISGQGQKYSVKKRIHQKLSESKIEKEEKNREKIKETLSEIQKEVQNTVFPSAGVNIQIYSKIYFNKIIDIENEIINTIAAIHSQFKKYDKFMGIKSIKSKILPQLIQKLTEFIDVMKKEPNSNPFIKFIDIYGFIITPSEEVDLNYEAYRFRVNIANSFPMYTKENCGQEIYDCTSCKDCKNCNLACFMEKFKELSVVQVSRLLKNIAVARDVSSLGHQIPADVEIHETIFDYLRKVDKFKLEKNTRVSAYKDKKNYWCTCERRITSEKLKAYKSNIVEVLFEADFLIADRPSEQLEIKGIIDGFYNDETTDFNPEIQEKLREYRVKILNTKTNIQAITIENAKEVLCDD